MIGWLKAMGRRIVEDGISNLVFWSIAAVIAALGGASLLFTSLRTWLAEPALFTRLWLVLLLVTCAGMCICAVWFGVQARHLKAAIATARARQIPQVTTTILEKSDWSVLKVFGLSPSPVSVTSAAGSLRKIDRPRIHLAIDRLKKLEYLIGAGLGPTGDALYELTAAGREECHRKGWI
jgi:hypothetical protein